ncbi:MAG: polyphenol oxidase family protein [Elusimicrobia bacterium]|nr:polyphenol oxidase family protein [Elusimicrobiota bacterium]
MSDLLTASWRKHEGLFIESRLGAAGVPHGVTTRGLGNMKDEARRRSALESLGLEARTLRVLKQVHGTQVHEASSGEGALEGDGWICADRNFVAGVYAADCLPLFLWSSGLEAVGVFHAGWRGIAAGMPRAAVRAFRRYGMTPEKLSASIGPHIGACCYPVGADVAEQFRAEARLKTETGTALDLGEEARLQLVESGISPALVSVSADCTSCLAGDLFSYRREKLDQRMLAFIALPDRRGGN